MSSENWLMFKSTKEAKRAMEYLAPLGGFLGIEGKWSCWIEYKHRCTRIIQIGVNAGSSYSDIHNFARRELCRRFDVRRIGHSGVGWYQDSDLEHVGIIRAGIRYPDYTSWVLWARDYKVEWSLSLPLPLHEYYPGSCSQEDYDVEYKAAMDDLPKVEAHVVSVFEELGKAISAAPRAKR